MNEALDELRESCYYMMRDPKARSNRRELAELVLHIHGFSLPSSSIRSVLWLKWTLRSEDAAVLQAKGLSRRVCAEASSILQVPSRPCSILSKRWSLVACYATL